MNARQRRKDRRRQERRKDARHVRSLYRRAEFFSTAHERVSTILGRVEALSFWGRVRWAILGVSDEVSG